MYFRVIACNVLTREISWCAARSVNTLDIEFLPKNEHNVPSRLRQRLQHQIDEAVKEDAPYDAVLLAYGLCGNSTVGLQANTFPLVIPRAHDCTTLYLGSKKCFQEHFGDNPSRPWSSIGYSERGDAFLSDGNARMFGEDKVSFAEMVEIYGEENARYILDAMSAGQESDHIPFIDVPETHVPALAEALVQKIASAGKQAAMLPGNIGLLQDLLSGNWPEDQFLVVPPGHRIEGVYDGDEIIRATGAP